MKAIAIAAILLLAATGASYSQQRHGGSWIHPGGQHGFGGHPRGSQGNAGIWRHPYGGGGAWGHRNDDFAGGVLGGIIGGAIGSIFAPDPPQVVIVPAPPPAAGPPAWTPEWFAYCAARYKSFQPESGNFTGLDGVQRFCR